MIGGLWVAKKKDKGNEDKMSESVNADRGD